jgi:hypothetical protein
MAVTGPGFDHWITRGQEQKAAYLISVCDTFDYDDYPVFVMENENLEKLERNMTT